MYETAITEKELPAAALVASPDLIGENRDQVFTIGGMEFIIDYHTKEAYPLDPIERQKVNMADIKQKLTKKDS